MALKNVQRVTFSLPKATIHKLESSIPNNKRSKFVADLIEKELRKVDMVSLEDVHEFWSNLANLHPTKTNKSLVELQREDRLSH